MTAETTNTLVIGAGQAGIAMSEHLTQRGIPHIVVERSRIAERWRTERWDSLVANGPAWHDRFPNLTFANVEPDDFAPRASIVDYFEAYAAKIHAPIRCGVNVTALHPPEPGRPFLAETNAGPIHATNVIVATGPFQRPHIPPLVPPQNGIAQLHSAAYRNPAQLPDGHVLVVGAGSSGVQIADELLRAGRRVHLAVGPHNRPPRRYRGRDFVWWLGVLGKWSATICEPGREHITIAVSGAHGGHTVDFRDMARRGITLLGRAEKFHDGTLHFAADLAQNVALGDKDYLSVLDEADAYAARESLDLPEDPEARLSPPIPLHAEPVLELHLANAGITSIVWATGYALDLDWLPPGALDPSGRPRHHGGISAIPGLYHLGLPWLRNRASAFIWGVWQDAAHLADHIATRDPHQPHQKTP